MLEAKELVKIYKPKKGVPVRALNGINLKFPDKGMIFLLGKSGSGKSTLLNVLGGLDKYDGGEIIINGVSSKDFKQSHFDSYRNTYVGFIFQEYNILEEFTVGANIALAIELQGKKAEDGEINRILKEVDLEGYGNRKPNELSGGQKQRVAIARALVKNPEIIMADEPTGALDSVTGRQVFDTLKKLSEEKLVIVVSHDREFAEGYADRIIELSDGNIISDVELAPQSGKTEIESGISFAGNTVNVPVSYHLTEDDRIKINEYIDKVKSGEVSLVISKGKSSLRFVDTDISKIKDSKSGPFKLIKSKLPMKNAFKMGAGALKYKKIRLVITIILSCISFGLFGLADTFGSYDHIKTCTNSIYDTKTNFASVGKSKRVKYAEDGEAYWTDGYKLSDDDLSNLSSNTGINFKGAYIPSNMSLDFSANLDSEKKLTESNYNIYNFSFSAVTPIDDEILKRTNYKLLEGTLPEGNTNEIAVSEYVYEVFKKAGYTDGTKQKDKKGNEVLVYSDIKSYSDIIGKKIKLGETEYTICAVIDTGLDLKRYERITEKQTGTSSAEKLVNYALYNELMNSTGYSYAGLMMVSDDKFEALLATKPNVYDISKGYITFISEKDDNYLAADPQKLTVLDKLPKESIVWANGAQTVLLDKEIIISEGTLSWDGDFVVTDEETGKINYPETLKKLNREFELSGLSFASGKNITEKGFKIVGIIPSSYKDYNDAIAVSERVFNMFSDIEEGNYDFAVGAMPKDKEIIGKFVKYCYNKDSGSYYPVQNSVTYELDTVNGAFSVLSKVFLYVGIAFALFASLMLANFIATSISYKKQEIGILRAIGSRGNDVFRIFFAESFIIAMINFVLSSVGVFAATMIINSVIRHRLNILITVLSFGIRQIALLFAVSLVIAALASFLPVKRIASKKPIDAIRNR